MTETGTLKEELSAIDKAIEGFKTKTARSEALKRLNENQDFVDVILNGYIEEEVEKLFLIMTDPNNRADLAEEEIVRSLDAVKRFKAYLGDVKVNGDNAQDLIVKEEQYRKQVTAAYGDI